MPEPTDRFVAEVDDFIWPWELEEEEEEEEAPTKED